MENHNIVFLGDSLTKGNFSANWVKFLSQLVDKKFSLINLAENGQTTHDILKTIRNIDSYHPFTIVLFCGTNDIKSHLSDKAYKVNRNAAIRNISSIIKHLRLQTSSAKFLLVSLPPLGEENDSQELRIIEDFNQHLYQVAIAEEIEYVPFYESLSQHKLNFSGTSYKWGVWIKYKTLFLRFVLFLSWNKISEINGYKFLTDSLHLNLRAGEILAKLVADQLFLASPNK